MVPYHSLGFHQCRWGYNNWSEFADVLANFEKFEIPLEYLWYVPHWMSIIDRSYPD
jgi:alpha-glucosidase